MSCFANAAAALVWAGLLCLTCPSAKAEDPDLGRLLELNLQARNAAGLARVDTIRVSFTLLQPELTARVLLQARKPTQARIDVWIAGERVFSESGDGQSGWYRVRGGPPRRSAAAGAARLGDIAAEFLFPLKLRAEAGYSLTTRPATRIDGKRYNTLRLEKSAAPPRLLFLDPGSGFVTRERAVTALQPDLNPQRLWIEVLHSDFRLVDGVAYSFQRDFVDVTTLDWLQTLMIEDVVLNAPLAPGVFEPGAEPDWDDTGTTAPQF